MSCMFCSSAPVRKPRTVRTVIITVLSTVLAILVGMGILGTVLPSGPAALSCISKSTTIKSTQ